MKFIKKHLLILCFCLTFFAIKGFTQTQRVSKTDSSSINLVLNHLNNILTKKPDSAIILAKQIITASEKAGYLKGQAKANQYLGLLMINAKEYKSSIPYFENAINIFSQLKDKKSAADAIYKMAYAYNYLGESKVTIGYYKKALENYIKIKDSVGIAKTYNNLAIVYDTNGDYGTAIDFYFKTYQIDKKIGRTKSLGSDLNNIGQLFETLDIHDKAAEYLQKSINASEAINDSASLCYSYESLATVYLNQKKTEKALILLKKSLLFSNAIPDDDIISLIYADISKAFLAIDKIDSAKVYLAKSLKISEQRQIPYNTAFGMIYEAQLFNKINKPFKAISSANDGLKIAKKIGSIPLEINLLIELKSAYAQIENYKLAFETQEKAINLSKDLNTGETIKKITALLLTKEYEKKEIYQNAKRAIKDKFIKNKLNNKNLLIVIFIIITLFTIVISIILYLNHKKQKEANELLMIKNDEIDRNRSEIKDQASELAEHNEIKDRLFTIISHDLRKPIHQLSSVINLLEENLLNREEMEHIMPSISESVKDTSELLDSLLFWAKSQMKGFKLRIIETNIKVFVDEKLNHLQQNAKEKEIQIVNEVADNILIKIDELLMSIILRNLVSNAIKFSNAGDKISISFSEDKDNFNLLVMDTGAGMNNEQLGDLFTPKVKSTKGTKDEVGSGLGLIFCKDLIEKSGGRILVSSELGAGSEFCLKIPKYN
ncbi:MAG: tetratricopeptide repeat-containing sensor histidine kinase [Bacteroidetes bacterium]|nr:tetratricopeptide repeat-containing sensor histidine kinase [Bacteroidota bacterium]MBU1484686.1 tetratricopeptide repeat-containing sensor histidine kinase [Bacteroidota bacterium]MBU2267526.1 tetratricopeptide repeat-containing sensor histidine kinase [Bacteroidota bacterium]